MTTQNIPAFPDAPSPQNGFSGAPGMSLRDWFAGQVIGGIVADPTVRRIEYTATELARKAYVLADAMIAEREKGGGV